MPTVVTLILLSHTGPLGQSGGPRLAQKRSSRQIRGAIAALSCTAKMNAMLRYVLNTDSTAPKAYSAW